VPWRNGAGTTTVVAEGSFDAASVSGGAGRTSGAGRAVGSADAAGAASASGAAGASDADGATDADHAGQSSEPAWRISIATIDRSAPFSEFAGVDRLLMPLSPAGVDLVVDGARVRGEAFDVLPFAGESAVEAVDVRGTGLDLNLMTRRGEAVGTLVAQDLDGELTLGSPSAASSDRTSAWTVAVVLEGRVVSLAHGPFVIYDAVVVPPGGALQVTGRAAVIALAVIEPTRASSANMLDRL
jgi:hypothetical protein